MVCITIPKDQRTAAGCQLPSYHLVRMIKITFPAPLPLQRHLFWQLQCLHFCTAAQESQLMAPSSSLFQPPLTVSLRRLSAFQTSQVPCGGAIANCVSATCSLSTYTSEVPHPSLAERSKHFYRCVFVNTSYFLVLTPMNKALIPFNQYTYLPKIHDLFPYASSPLPMRDSLMTFKRQSSAKGKCLNQEFRCSFLLSAKLAE